MKTVALVTGGNKGIGLQVTRRLLAQEVEVLVAARDFSGFELAGRPGVQTLRVDLSEPASVENLLSRLPPVDLLVNNAGIMHSFSPESYPEAEAERLLQVNLKAPVVLMQRLGAKMAERGRGRIVNNASIAGQIGHPDFWYGVSKAGLINATKSFAKIYGPRGVLVNAVAPSPVDTDMLATIPEARRRAFLSTVTSQRFADADEVAAVLVWLGLEAPEYLNGATLDLNSASYLR